MKLLIILGFVCLSSGISPFLSRRAYSPYRPTRWVPRAFWHPEKRSISHLGGMRPYIGSRNHRNPGLMLEPEEKRSLGALGSSYLGSRATRGLQDLQEPDLKRALGSLGGMRHFLGARTQEKKSINSLGGFRPHFNGRQRRADPSTDLQIEQQDYTENDFGLSGGEDSFADEDLLEYTVGI